MFMISRPFTTSAYDANYAVALFELDDLPFQANKFDDDCSFGDECHTLSGYGLSDPEPLHPRGPQRLVSSRPCKPRTRFGDRGLRASCSRSSASPPTIIYPITLKSIDAPTTSFVDTLPTNLTRVTPSISCDTPTTFYNPPIASCDTPITSSVKTTLITSATVAGHPAQTPPGPLLSISDLLGVAPLANSGPTPTVRVTGIPRSSTRRNKALRHRLSTAQNVVQGSHQRSSNQDSPPFVVTPRGVRITRSTRSSLLPERKQVAAGAPQIRPDGKRSILGARNANLA